MRYDVTWTLPNGEKHSASFDDEFKAKEEAVYRANQYVIKHHRCEILVADENGQPILIQTNSYHA